MGLTPTRGEVLMVRYRAWSLISVAMLFCIVACGPLTDGGELDDEVVETLRVAVEDAVGGRDGGAVALIDTPGEQLVLAAGEADVAEGRELTGDEAFHIASVTKVFTSTVALQLVEEGTLALDTPVAEVVPDQMSTFEYGDQVTLRHLLSHASGLPDFTLTSDFRADHTALSSAEGGPRIAVLETTCEPMDLLDYAAEQRASFAPGTGGEYADTNYVLAGQVIEAVTGQTLDAVYRERIFEPLDLEGTWFPCAEQPLGDLAHGYDYPALGAFPDLEAEILDVTAYHMPFVSGATGLVSTGEDLAVFARALFAGELFDDDATLDMMLEPGQLGAGTDDRYGLGVGLEDEVMGHDGVTVGYTSFLRYHESTDTLVVVLSNVIAQGVPSTSVSAGRPSSRSSPTRPRRPDRRTNTHRAISPDSSLRSPSRSAPR